MTNPTPPYVDAGATIAYAWNLLTTAWHGQPDASSIARDQRGVFSPESRVEHPNIDQAGMEARYGKGSFGGQTSKGNLRGEAIVPDVAVDVLTHESNPGQLSEVAVEKLRGHGLSEQDLCDFKMVVGSKEKVETLYRKLFGREPGVGDQAPKPGTPDNKARAALQAIKAAADKTKKPPAQGGGAPAGELRKLLVVIDTEAAKGLAS